MSESKRDDELLSAYVDGIGELTPDERRRVELADLRTDEAATRELLGELRELPPTGGPPDWSALERSIAEATGPEVPRAPWWRRRFALPAFAVAMSAAIVFLVVRPDREAAPLEPIVTHPAPTIETPDPVVAVYLDGIDMELTGEELLDDPFEDLVTDDDTLDVLAPDMLAPDDLAWVDELDDEDLERVESYLERGRG